MPDRYQSLAHTSVGRILVRNLGLPNPVPLERHRPGAPLVTGTVRVGGAGRLGDAVVKALSELGVDVEEASDDRRTTTGDPQDRVRGLVFDATGIEDSASLAALHGFFAPRVRGLRSCGRVVVLGTPPESCRTPQAAVAQRALEGFTRSLGKEVGRGSTVQLVYVAPGAEDAVSSTLAFLLSARSAYVSGQVVRIGTLDGPPAGSAVDPDRPLEGRVALVTGAARGIGESIARVLARDGATVVGVDVPQAASELFALTRELGGEPVTLDITSVDAPQRIARHLSDKHDGVDIVVNNAGITRDKKLANMDDERWRSTIAVNLTAPERITGELLDQHLLRDNGRVVGVASIAGIAGNAGQTNYSTSKAGVIGFVQSLAPLTADRGINVNAVAPGFIETQMTARMPVLLREAGRRMNSMAQGGLPVDVAETVAWFAHPGSTRVTGNVVRVCGQSLLGA